MKPLVGGEDRRRGVSLPEFLDACVAEDNLVRVIDVFVDALGFEGAVPEVMAWPAYHPATLLKIVSTATSTGSSRTRVWINTFGVNPLTYAIAT
jgi:hypothetical protein